MEIKEKPQVKEIKILWIEGDDRQLKLESRVFTQYFAINWELSQVLQRMRTDKTQGYNKCKLEVTFENGRTFVFRYDIGDYEKVDIREYLFDLCMLYAGFKKTRGVTEEEWLAEPLNQKYVEFLRNYNVACSQIAAWLEVETITYWCEPQRIPKMLKLLDGNTINIFGCLGREVWERGDLEPRLGMDALVFTNTENGYQLKQIKKYVDLANSLVSLV